MRIFYLVFLFCSHHLRACIKEQNYFHVTPSSKLLGRVINTKIADSFLKCAQFCMREGRCESLSYGLENFVCELHGNDPTAISTLIYSDSYIYAEVSRINDVPSSKPKIQSLLFPVATTTNYAMLRNLITRPLSAITACFWMRTSDVTTAGTPLSYSAVRAGGNENEILVHNYKGFVVAINGERRNTKISANDGKWHHICFAWQSSNGSWAIYKDGQASQNATGFKNGYKIKHGGVLVLGQDQDSDGDSFEASQSFIGEMVNFNMWSYVLTANEILQLNKSCAIGSGDIIQWSLAIGSLLGSDVKVVQNPTCI